MSNKKRKAPSMYHFTGTATVSVECEVEADSEAQARDMVNSGDCMWKCEDVDGDVDGIELTGSDE